MNRVFALLRKELLDLRQSPTVFLAAAITGLLSIAIPFFVAVVVPYFAGERLSDSSDFEIALEMYKSQPEFQALDPEAAVQAWIFQTFLIFMIITPVAGAMSIAAFSVVGEKQARTLEPLLATPISTVELLAAKVLGALLPALLLFAARLRRAMSSLVPTASRRLAVDAAPELPCSASLARSAGRHRAGLRLTSGSKTLRVSGARSSIRATIISARTLTYAGSDASCR